MDITISVKVNNFEDAKRIAECLKALKESVNAEQTTNTTVINNAVFSEPQPVYNQMQIPENIQYAPPAPIPTQQVAAPAPAPIMQPPVAVPTAVPTYTLDQLAVAATPLMDAGRRNEIVSLLSQFGVAALTQLPQEAYGSFATALRGMGANI